MFLSGLAYKQLHMWSKPWHYNVGLFFLSVRPDDWWSNLLESYHAPKYKRLHRGVGCLLLCYYFPRPRISYAVQTQQCDQALNSAHCCDKLLFRVTQSFWCLGLRYGMFFFFYLCTFIWTKRNNIDKEFDISQISRKRTALSTMIPSIRLAYQRVHL